jgi:uncharacterized protein (TIGR02246 family)
MIARMLKATTMLGGVLLVAACSGNKGAATADTANGAVQAGTPANDAAVRQMVDSADRKFEAAMKSGDAATAASFYEENATSAPPNMEPETGRAAIEKGYGDMLKMTGKITDFSTQIKDLDAYADHAIEIGSYAMTFTPAGAKDPVKDHGTYFNYWRKQSDGSWKIHRDAIVSAVPMQNMAPPMAPAKK